MNRLKGAEQKILLVDKLFLFDAYIQPVTQSHIYTGLSNLYIR